MSAMQFKFKDIRLCFTGEQLAAFDIVSKHFPTIDTDSPLMQLDFIIPHHRGGTFLSNWNLTVEEANLALEIIAELDCACYFILPIASPLGFPPEEQEKFAKMQGFCMSQMKIFKIMPPFFAIHTHSPSQVCAAKYRNLALAKLMDNEKIMEENKPGVVEDSAIATADFMHKIMMKKG